MPSMLTNSSKSVICHLTLLVLLLLNDCSPGLFTNRSCGSVLPCRGPCLSTWDAQGVHAAMCSQIIKISDRPTTASIFTHIPVYTFMWDWWMLWIHKSTHMDLHENQCRSVQLSACHLCPWQLKHSLHVPKQECAVCSLKSQIAFQKRLLKSWTVRYRYFGFQNYGKLPARVLDKCQINWHLKPLNPNSLATAQDVQTICPIMLHMHCCLFAFK